MDRCLQEQRPGYPVERIHYSLEIDKAVSIMAL